MAKWIKFSKPLSEDESQEQIRQINEVFPSSPSILIRSEIERFLYIRNPDSKQDQFQIETLVSEARAGKNVLLSIKKKLGLNAVERYNQGADIEVRFNDYVKWISALTREKQMIHFRLGFEGCKGFVQQHLQKAKMSREEYLQAKLTPEDFRFYYSMVKWTKRYASQL